MSTAQPPLVSVIVPVYNAALYLAECLESLLTQTLTDLEIIAVDDGTADGCAEILAAFAARDARLRVITFAENQGVSAARNAGLALACGQYIGFCDADDWAEPTLFAALYEAATQKKAAVAFCAVVKHYPHRTEETLLPWPDGTVFDAAAIRADLIPNMLAQPQDSEELPVSGYTPRNLFARELLTGHTFRADIGYAEDLLFIIGALLKAERAAVVAAPLYHYRFHGGSTTQRYSPHIPASLEQSQQALASLFAQHGVAGVMAGRLAIRARKNTLTTVVNLCLPGTPYLPLPRWAEIRRVLRSPETKARFGGLPLFSLPPKLALKYGLIKARLALPLLVLYSVFYRTR